MCLVDMPFEKCQNFGGVEMFNMFSYVVKMLTSDSVGKYLTLFMEVICNSYLLKLFISFPITPFLAQKILALN